MTLRTISMSLVVCLSLLFGATSFAGDQISYKPSQDSFKLENGKATITLDAKIKEGWYTYSVKVFQDEYGIGPQATEILLQDDAKFEIVGKLSESKTIKKYDEGFEMDIEIHKKKASFSFDVQPKQQLEPGTYSFNALVYRQMCDSARCLPGEEDTIAVSVVIPEGAAVVETISLNDEQGSNVVESDGADDANLAAAGNTSTDNETNAQNVETDAAEGSSTEEVAAEEESNLDYFFVAMLAGLLALTTPCVFPMIPITVSFFTKRAEKDGNSGLLDAGVYSLGIILTFTALGVVIAALFGAEAVSGMATNPWINLGIAALFIVFALNLFGAIEIQLPSGLMNKLNQKSMQGKGLGAVLLMGLTFSLTSFTCTVPFVGGALFNASTSGDFVKPIIGMLGFSSVFAAPFFLLALFPSYLSKMPKAGGWMNNIKVVMGFLEVAFAMKFISNADMVWFWGILNRELFLAIWIGCAFLITLYVLGVYKFHHDSDIQGVTAPRAMFAVVFSAVTFYLVSGMFGKSLGELDAFIPPENYQELMVAGQGGTVSVTPPKHEDSGGHAAMNWLKDLDKGYEIAAREGKNVFVDFTGYTCTNCRWMEKNRFEMDNIQSKMNEMVLVQLYTDGRDDESRKNKQLQMDKFNSIDLPLYVILTPEGEMIAKKAFTRDIAEFEEFLDQGL